MLTPVKHFVRIKESSRTFRTDDSSVDTSSEEIAEALPESKLVSHFVGTAFRSGGSVFELHPDLFFHSCSFRPMTGFLMPAEIPTPLPRSWVAILQMLAEYYVLVRPQIQAGVFPGHKNSRYSRKVLSDMMHLGLIGKTRRKVTYDNKRSGCPVYYLKQKGIFELVKATQDDAFANASTARPREDRLEHWIATSETHRKLRQAVENQNYVALSVFVNEWNKYRTDGKDQYVLHVMLQQQPKISCSPDGAFVLSVSGLKSAVYLESDLGTSYEAQVVARKHMGYEKLAQSGVSRTRHFPDVTDNDFRVLMITTDRWRRDRLARHMKGQPGASRWRFAAVGDVTPESILHERIMVDCNGEPNFLVKAPASYTPLNINVIKNQAKTDIPRDGGQTS